MPANLENSAVATGLATGQFLFQSQRKAVPKNAQTTTQLHSFHTSKVMLKILQVQLKPGLKNFPQFVVIYTVKGFGVINKAEAFLEFSCLFCDLTDVGNLISGSSAFSKTSLNI